MAGGLFNRLKVWAFEEVLKSKDLNAEFDNIINHLSPQFVASFSQTLSQMQLQLDPGELGTEHLAQSTAEEIEELRFVIARITGLPFWYQSPPLSLSEINTILQSAVGLPPNRIVSGLSRTGSEQPIFLQPSGSGLTATLKASISVPFVCFIDGTQHTFTADIPIAGLTPGPNVNNVATINDTLLAGERWTKLVGEQQSAIQITTAGTEITNMTGSLAAFQNPNAGNEIFLSRIESSTILDESFRGFFFDSTNTPIQRDILNNSDIITIRKLSWIFLQSAGTLDVTYNEPVYQGTAPLTPSNGDYWFDTANDTWKKFNGTSFMPASALIVGMTVQNTTNCIAARSQDFFKIFQYDNTMRARFSTTTSIKTHTAYNTVNVYGKKLVFDSVTTWNYPIDLDAGLVSTDQDWFFYLTNNGSVVISDQYPYDRMNDLKGWYHPYQTWLCIAGASVGRNQAGKLPAVTGTIDPWTMISFGAMKPPDDMPGLINQDMYMYDTSHRQIRDGFIPLRFDLNFFASRMLLFRAWQFQKNAVGDASDIPDSEQFALPGLDGQFLRVVDPSGTADPDFLSRHAYNMGGNTAGNTGSAEFADISSGATNHRHSMPASVLNTTTINYQLGGTVATTILSSGGNLTNFANAYAGFGSGLETRPLNIYVALWFKY